MQAQATPGDQGFCVVLVEPGGERAYVYNAGAERRAGAADLAALPAADFAWVLLGGYVSPDAGDDDVFGDWLDALPRGVRLMFDPTPLALSVGRERLERALTRADWVSANAREAEALTGKRPEAAALDLSRGREGAIVRDGARGCWLASGGPAVHVEGFAVEAVDTTGAGDTHIGAFIAARLSGQGPAEAARFANAAAALSVTRLGAATAPTRAQVEALLKSSAGPGG